jgi:hypothetical protein
MVLAASRSILGAGGESVNEGNTLRARLESPESGTITGRSGVDLGERPCRQLHGIEGHASSARVSDAEKRRAYGKRCSGASDVAVTPLAHRRSPISPLSRQ